MNTTPTIELTPEQLKRQAILNEQDPTLDAALNDLDNTFATVTTEYMPVAYIKQRRELLALMTEVHSQITPKINQMRMADAGFATAKKQDFILDNPKENYAALLK